MSPLLRPVAKLATTNTEIADPGARLLLEVPVSVFVSLLSLPLASTNTDGAAEASMLSVPVNFAAVPDKATAARSKSKVSLLVLVTVNRNTLPDEPGVTDTAATSAVATAKITGRAAGGGAAGRGAGGGEGGGAG